MVGTGSKSLRWTCRLGENLPILYLTAVGVCVEGGMLSEWGLRERAAGQGVSVSHRQFAEYRRWGLLPAPDPTTGRWPVGVVKRLVRVRQLGEVVRPLPRRVVLLYPEFFVTGVPIGFDELREAMAALAPTIRAPARKMRRLHAACRAWSAQWSPLATARPLPRDWRPPSPTEWVTTLRAAASDIFAERVGVQYHLAALLRDWPGEVEYGLPVIPREEQVTLLTVRDLAVIECQRAQNVRALAAQHDR